MYNIKFKKKYKYESDLKSGIGEHINIYNDIKQMPKDTKVMCYGFN